MLEDRLVPILRARSGNEHDGGVWARCVNVRRRGTYRPHDITGASATGTAITHTAATTTSYVHFHGVANAIRACAASNNGYQPADQMMWKAANTAAQSAAA